MKFEDIKEDTEYRWDGTDGNGDRVHNPAVVTVLYADTEDLPFVEVQVVRDETINDCPINHRQSFWVAPKSLQEIKYT